VTDTPDTTATQMESEKKFRVRVTISSLSNERRVINLGECSEEQLQSIVGTVQSAFGTIRSSQALTLTGSDGVATFANIDNIAFVEVHVA